MEEPITPPVEPQTPPQEQPIPEEPKPVGRPSIFSQELADRICIQLSQGLSLRRICEAEDMPNASTVHEWVLKDVQGFAKQYAQARAIQAEMMFDEILEISDISRKDIVGGEDRSDNARVQAHRLRVDSRKWYLSKVLPKKFGEKMDVTSDGKALKGNMVVFKEFKEDDATGS